MAMFGGFNRSRSPFQAQPPLTTPGIGDGLPGATPMGSYISPETRSILDNAPSAKPGFGTKDVIGIIGDALSAAGGGQGVYTQMKLQDRQRQRMLEQAQLQRQAEMQDWVARERYKAANPDPLTPHYWETNDGSLGVVGPDGKPSILYKDPTPKMETIQVRDPATGEVKWYRVPQGGGDSAISPQPGSASPNPASSFEPDVLLNRAIQQGFISPEDYASVKGKLGPNGQTALDGWMTGSKIKIGQQIDGKMYYQINGKWYDNPEGR